MNIAFNIILLLHVAAAIGIIVLVLLQHGKGADMGAAFGGGSSGSLFGASGSANFMSRMTGILAAVFFLTSLSMAYLATHKPKSGGGIMDSVTTVPAAPVLPGVPSPAAIPGQSGASAPVAPSVPAVPAATGGAEVPKSTQIPK
jgi:preprotein translocase subunit SecG